MKGGGSGERDSFSRFRKKTKLVPRGGEDQARASGQRKMAGAKEFLPVRG